MSTVRRHHFAVGVATAVLAMTVPDARLVGRQQAPQSQPTAPRSPAPVFRTGINLVLVDVVVRDKSGGIVRNLTADDFDLLEDGRRQQIATFTFEEINPNAASVTSTATLSAATATGRRGAGASTVTATAVAPGTAPSAPAADAVPAPLTSEAVAGHRLITLLFDTSSMQPEDLQKAAESAVKWVAEEMSPADLVAVASIGSTLKIVSDFTGSKEAVRSALAAFSPTDSTAFTTVDASTAATDEANSAATDDTATVDTSAQELDTFNNDVRLRALKTLAEALMPIQQKKAII
jgi:VWFA-related protein